MTKTVTLNIDETIDERFREKARLKYGNRKGSLARAINEALEEWLKENDQEVLSENSKLLESGIRMKKWEFERDELHDR